MNNNEKRRERRKQRRLEEIGTNHPVCLACGDTTWYQFEGHHIAARRFGKHVEYYCAHCHRELTERQKSHPLPTSQTPGPVECTGHYALGLADIFDPIAHMLEHFGYRLVDLSDSAELRSDSTKQLVIDIGRYLIVLAGFLERVGEHLKKHGTRLIDEAPQAVTATKTVP